MKSENEMRAVYYKAKKRFYTLQMLTQKKMRTSMWSIAVTRKFAKIYSNTAELRASSYVDLAAIFKLHSLLGVLLKMKQPSL